MRRFFLLILLVLAGAVSAKIIDGIAAVVNDDVITISEVRSRVALVSMQWENIGKEEYNKRIQEEWEKQLQTLIEDKLILQEAKASGLEVSENEVEAQIEEMKKKFSSEEEFYRTLQKQGLSLPEVKKMLEEELLKEKLIRRAVLSKINVGEKEIEAYYEQHKDEFMSPPQIGIARIAIKKGPDATELVNKIMDELKAGKNFSDLARQYSQTSDGKGGGELGFFKKGELSQEVEDVVWTLDVGQVSEPVEAGDYICIFKVTGKKLSEPKPLESVRSAIESILRREKIRKAYEEFVQKLKEKAFIEVKLGVSQG